MRKVRFRVEDKIYKGNIKDRIIITNNKEVGIDEVEILPPCRPSKIVGIARNYADHADELGNKVPEFPFIFFKPPNTLIGHKDKIKPPENSKNIHYEGEVGIIIGEKTKDIGKKNAIDHILGYTCVNDITARDWQERESQWARAKGSDTFCPIGPCIQTDLDKIRDGISIETRLNGEKRQSSNTSKMVFSISELISNISKFITLNKGDVISTGTPEGVGKIKSNDKIEIKVEKVGTLVNKVA